jgi:hypothetical protein
LGPPLSMSSLFVIVFQVGEWKAWGAGVQISPNINILLKKNNLRVQSITWWTYLKVGGLGRTSTHGGTFTFLNEAT